MIIKGKYNENEEQKIKALVNIEINGFDLKGFKIAEVDKMKTNENGEYVATGEKELRLLFPSSGIKDPNTGEYIKDENDKIKNFTPIVINKVLANKKELFNGLQNLVIEAYNENKGKETFEKNVKNELIEKGELNVSPFIVYKQETSNPNYQYKSRNNIFIGAFQVSGVNLFYNTKNNDYTVMLPGYTKEVNGERKNFSFVVPKNEEVYAKLKNKLSSAYVIKDRELKQDYIAKKQNNKQVDTAFETQYQENNTIAQHQ